MQKLILLGLTTVCTAWGARAQGTVTFGNTSSTLVMCAPGLSGPYFPPVPVPVGIAKIALYWGVHGSSEAMLVQIGGTANIAPVPGRFSGGTRTTGNATAPGTMATFQVRVWSAAFNTYEEALFSGNPATAFLGKTVLFNSLTGGEGIPASPPVNLAPVMPQLFVHGIGCIPEPSVTALALLGVVSVLIFRRRK